MAAPSKQLTLNFEKLTEKNLEPIAKRFKECGYNVVKIDAPNQARRESGMLIKNFSMTFEDGQTILCRVKAGGTIFQVKLNNKVMPIKAVDDMKKAIQEMADYMYGNAKSFARARAQREKRKIKGETRPSVTTTRAEKIAKAREELDALLQNIAEMEKEVAEAAPKVQELTGELDRLLEEKKQLTERLAALETEYKALGGK